VANKKEEQACLAIALKYDNDFNKIMEQIVRWNGELHINSEEIIKFTKDVEEKYVVLFSDNYPKYFRESDEPPFALFYEGNLNLFNYNGATFENPLDSDKEFYLAVSQDGEKEVDWCIAVTHEEDLLPVINRFLSDFEGELYFKKYANKDELSLS
jgi:hypothetical protein